MAREKKSKSMQFFMKTLLTLSVVVLDAYASTCKVAMACQGKYLIVCV